MKIENHILTIGAHSEELPCLPTPATVTAWKVPTEYIASGYFVTVRVADAMATIPACAAADTELIGTLDLPADPAAQLAAAKAERMDAINQSCAQALASIAAPYPDGEVKSWPQQVAEAAALAIVADAPTPLLTAIAAVRGISVVDLANLVRIKAEVYAAVSGQTIGRRQFLESALDAAETPEAVSAVAW